MSKRDPRLFVTEMVTACDKIERFIARLQESDFDDDELVQDAVLRNLEIIGEAAKQLSSEIRDRHSEVPWTRIIGFRNITIHTYFAVDLSIVWRIVTTNLPQLVRQPRASLDELSSDRDER